MSNWRISVLERDNTNTLEVSGAIVGATAFKAPKGPSVFTRFEKGASQSIIDSFGYPSVSYPGIQDAIDANSNAPVYLASPSGVGATYGGVFLTSEGTIPFVSGTAGQTIADYSAVACTKQVGVGAGGTTKTFTVTLLNTTHYKNQSIASVKVGTVSTAVSASNVATEVLTSAVLDTGSTYVRSTGVLTLVFLSAPALGAEITITYAMDISAITYATIYNKYSQADDLKVKIIENPDQAGTFIMTVYRRDPLQTGSVYVELSESPLYFGVASTDKDSYGETIYIEDVFGDEQILFTATVQNSTVATITDDVALVALAGGSRGTFAAEGETGSVSSAIATIFADLEDTNKYPVSLVFDVTGSDEVTTKFSALRAGDSMKYVSFAYPTANESAATILADIPTYRPTASRGIFCYALTWGVHTDVYQGHAFLCSNMGLVAERILNSMLLDPSAQPAYVNENSCGGQLKAGIKSLSQTLSDTQAPLFEIAKINPVTIDPFYGAMILGWRTTNSVNNVYSYIAQSVQADMMIKQIIRDACVPQQGKPNDDLHRTMVANTITSILNGFSKGLDAKYVKCDSSNNTTDIMNQQKFIVSVAVRFISYAKLITLNFVTTRFGTNVEEVIN